MHFFAKIALFFTKSPIFLAHLVNYLYLCTQIDMLIDREDRTINICEIKYSQGEYEISEAYDKVLREKLSIFQQATKTKKGVSLLMITSYGLKHNQWANSIHIQLTMDDLFAF